MKISRSLSKAIVVAAAVAVLLSAFLFGAQGGAVDWRDNHVVAIESDDWGFCGYVPDASAIAGLDLSDLKAGRYPPVYKGSTLETAAMIDSLVAVLNSVRGADGLPAVLQANYILSSLNYDPGADPRWTTIELPDFAPQYARPGLWEAVDRAIASGCWQPEYHGYIHYDPEARKAAVAADELAARAAGAGIILFPGGSRAFELGASRPDAILRQELQSGIRVFEGIFGHRPQSVIAPDYRWRRKDESMWIKAGFLCIQAKTEQRPTDGTIPGSLTRLGKYIERSWRRLSESRIVYLERNCRLEIAQTADTEALLDDCLREIRSGWERGEPAIIETHRVNFAHIDPDVVEHSLGVLRSLLETLVEDPDGRPIFLSDQEIATLNRSGVSARRVGEAWILRNLTHSTRLITLSDPSLDGEKIISVDPGVHFVKKQHI